MTATDYSERISSMSDKKHQFHKDWIWLPLVIALSLQPVARAAETEGDEEIRKRDAQSEENWAYSAGVQNYVFGLPTARSREAGEGQEDGSCGTNKPGRPYEALGDRRRCDALHA
jgi:hypothetical protein